MLTTAELIDCRNKLAQAQALVATVRDAFLGDGQGALLLSEIVRAIEDEIETLDKALGAAQP